MRGTILVGVCLGVLIGCGQETKTPTGESAEPRVAAPAAGGANATAGERPAATAPGNAECQAACEHRKSCNVSGGADVAKCVEDCTLVYDLTGKEGLATYTASSCDTVAQGERNFYTAVMCRRACRHRATCLPDADATTCEAECSGLILVADEDPVAALAPYLAADCATVKSEEAGFQVAGSCLRACGKMIECGVRSEMKSCLGECGSNIQSGATNAAEARTFAAQGCDQVRAQITPLPKPQARPPAASGLSGRGCLSNGAQDCPHFSKCCRNSDFTIPGSGPGQCISPAICLMPTR